MSDHACSHIISQRKNSPTTAHEGIQKDILYSLHQYVLCGLGNTVKEYFVSLVLTVTPSRCWTLCLFLLELVIIMCYYTVY
jgi:hypothetical protein